MRGSVQSLKRRGKMRCICAKGLFLFASVAGSGLEMTGTRWLQKWVVFEKLHQKMCPKIEKYKIWAKWLRPFLCAQSALAPITNCASSIRLGKLRLRVARFASQAACDRRNLPITRRTTQTATGDCRAEVQKSVKGIILIGARAD